MVNTLSSSSNPPAGESENQIFSDISILGKLVSYNL